MTSKCVWYRKRVSSHDRLVSITSFSSEEGREMIQTQIRLDKYESQHLPHIPSSQNHPFLLLLGAGRINTGISLIWGSTEV